MHRLKLPWRNWPLALKLSLTMTTMIVMVVGTVTLLSIRREQQTFRTELQQQAELLLDTLIAAAADPLYYLDADALSDMMETLGEDREILVSGRIYDAEGWIVADVYGEDAIYSLRADLFGQQLMESDTTVFEWQSDQLLAGRAVIAGRQRLGAVSVGLPTASLKDKVAAVRNRNLGVALVAAALGALLALLISRSITDPLRELARATQRIAEGDLTQKIAICGGDELAVLAGAFNNMTAQLQQTMARMQREIEERKCAEEQIQASLKQKEVLLKEIHHRVKNNLQVISSLLYLRSKGIKDKEALEMFQDSQNRVRSMALVHERLYQSQDLARIDFSEYVRKLAGYLFRSYGVHSDVIQLKINADDVFLGIDTAVPCGLMLNELVSNSLKHAFSDGREGEIRIELRSDDDGQFVLLVSDNGVGFPEDLELWDTGSLGLQLVNTLVDQLEGTIELDRSGGTAFEITFTELK